MISEVGWVEVRDPRAKRHEDEVGLVPRPTLHDCAERRARREMLDLRGP